MKLIPVKGKLFVKPTIIDKTVGGIIIPETSRSAPTEGVVLYAGQMKDERIVEGVNVLFRMHADEELEFEGEKFFMIVENDVLAVLDGE